MTTRASRPLERAAPAVRILVAIFALAGVAGQGVIYFGGGAQGSLNIGMPTVLGAGLAAGLAYGIAVRPLRGVGEIEPAKVPQPDLRRDNILTFTAFALIAGELLAFIALVSGNWRSGVALAAPLLYGGLFTLFAALAGVLVAEMILWPVAEIFLTTGGALRGRPVNQRLLATSLALLSIVAFAIFLKLSTHVPVIHGGTRQSGVLMIIRLFVDYSGGTVNQIEAWIARALVVALAAEIVWAVRAPRVARDTRGEAHRPSRGE